VIHDQRGKKRTSDEKLWLNAGPTAGLEARRASARPYRSVKMLLVRVRCTLFRVRLVRD
jgi:hypothetical protein